MSKQVILEGLQNIETILYKEQVNRCFIVHGQSLEKKEAFTKLQKLTVERGIQIVSFKGYTSNPKVEEVQNGVELFSQMNCDFIIAVGGGSAIDVAKCIKQKINEGTEKTDKSYVKMLAIPTTAGTGSESTQFAVVYENGEKKSVDDADILPDYVILEAELLKGLPIYQRKATMLDALCQAIESIWAKKATEESRELAAEAIRKILDCYKGYLEDVQEDNRTMLQAANLAGQAINITRTTAAHAMSYKITSLYGAAHGHAVGACMKALWKWMLEHDEQSNKEELQHAYACITSAFGVKNIYEAYRVYCDMLEKMKLDIKGYGTDKQLKQLVNSVNIQRLSNHPIELSENVLGILYNRILNEER